MDHEIGKAYEEVVHWWGNLFKIPSGGLGKAFLQDMASLFQSYADASAREKVAVKAAMVPPVLVLQGYQSWRQHCTLREVQVRRG